MPAMLRISSSPFFKCSRVHPCELLVYSRPLFPIDWWIQLLCGWNTCGCLAILSRLKVRRNDPFICSGLSTFTSEAFQTTSSFPCRPACRRNSTAQKRGPHLMMATTGLLVVLARQLFIYSLLIVANESHLGALPGLFADHHQQQDGCDHDHGPAPSFSAPQNGSTVKGHQGAPAQLHCNIQDLHHRAVSWIRKTEDDLQLLTVGESSHTADPRINPEFIYPHLWQLKFNPAMINDSGTYLCHISTDPPLIRYIHLEISVPEPIVEIVDSQTDAAVSSDRVLYYRIGSSLELRCRVRHYWIKPKIFQWLKSGTPVADELWRGGISIYTEITKPGQLENKLSIANATINDGGNYTCSLDSFSFSIVVHFLKEEKQAASQHATNGGRLSLALHSLNRGLVRHLLLSFLLQIVIVHHHHLFRVVR